jgi:hypothetical protein
MTLLEADNRDCEEGAQYPLDEITPELGDELLQHPGKWAAITLTEVIELGDDPSKVLKTARDRGYTDPILYHIPEASTLYFF